MTKKIDGKVYGHHLQIDGSERRYAYVRIQDEKFFDIVTLLDSIVKANKHLYNEKAININFEVENDLKKMVYQPCSFTYKSIV